MYVASKTAMAILEAIKETKNVDFQLTRHGFDVVKAILTTKDKSIAETIKVITATKLPLKTPSNKVLSLTMDPNGDVVISIINPK